MAGYKGKFSCGHEGKIYVTGPHKVRDYIIEKKFSGLCPECYQKKLNEEREKINKISKEKADEMELPELIGTEKQVAWAYTLRQKFIDNVELEINENPNNKKIFLDFEERIEANNLKEKLSAAKRELEKSIQKNEENKKCEEKIANIRAELKKKNDNRVQNEQLIIIESYMLENITSAAEWIDNRTYTVREVMKKYVKEALKTDEEKLLEKEESELEKKIEEETTVYPENRITDAVVVLEKKGDILKAKFEKNEKFRRIVKEQLLYWEDGCWQRKINFKAGNIKDRMAELGNKLLNEGFPIRITDSIIRENAIKGDYEEEYTRWISCITTGKYKGRLNVTWIGYNEKLYGIAKTLPGSIWENGMIIKVEHADAVEEFARLYNFKLSCGAVEAIANYREKMKEINTITPVVVEKKDEKDGLQDILNSSTEILEDLKEED